jgi:hypothetical protein
MANVPDIKYFDKDFSSLKQDLINYARTYFQNNCMDFSPSAPGNMFMEMEAYVGDVLSFYTDTQLQETLLLYAQERKNIIIRTILSIVLSRELSLSCSISKKYF